MNAKDPTSVPSLGKESVCPAPVESYKVSHDDTFPVMPDPGTLGDITPYAFDFMDPLHLTNPFLHGLGRKEGIKWFEMAKYFVC
eukprot:10474434-Ditylum_brightwellii.AAC.1